MNFSSDLRLGTLVAMSAILVIVLVCLFVLLELRDHSLVLVLVERDQGLPLPAEDQDAVGIGFRLEHVIRLPLDLGYVVDQVGFLFARDFVDQLDGLQLAVGLGLLDHVSLLTPDFPGSRDNSATAGPPPSGRLPPAVAGVAFPGRPGIAPQPPWSGVRPSIPRGARLRAPAGCRTPGRQRPPRPAYHPSAGADRSPPVLPRARRPGFAAPPYPP